MGAGLPEQPGRRPPTGTGDIRLFAARGEEPADLAPVRTGAGFRASMSYSVTDVRRLDV
ncbi:hypothetical protein [Streptomyces hokutonensis]|uniref:hypothetical protein n=1 Tax=Streptomyces hokutonensis TaxID=1306990 RepID=UPI00369A31C1